MDKHLKLIIIIFFSSVLLSFILFYMMYKETKLEPPIKEENLILNRYAAEPTRIRLSFHPAGSYISWNKEERHNGEVSLKLSIEESNTKDRYYSQINILTPLDLSSHRTTGFLEFWIKGGKKYSEIESLEFILKDKSDTQIMISVFQLITLSNEWQYVGIPLSEFSKKRASRWNGEKWVTDMFDWDEVDGIVFSTSPEKDGAYTEVFIDDFKIIDKKKTIYNLFYHYE